MPKPSLIKGAALKPGSQVAVVSPAGPSSVEALNEGVAWLESVGLKVTLLPCAAQNYGGYLAGTDAERAKDLSQALLNPNIDAVLFARGGYGCARLLQHLPWQELQAALTQKPKLIMGFSDVTVLLQVFYQRFGLVGLYSPMLTSNLIDPKADWTRQHWLEAVGLSENQSLASVPFVLPSVDAYQCLTSGTVEGVVRVANLTLLATLCGTPYQPNLTGAILVLEDWKERYYSLDRQLTQLHQAGLLQNLAGLLLADFTDCQPGVAPEFEVSLAQFFKTWLADAGLGHLPCGLGFTLGHGQQTATVPNGVLGQFQAQSGQLTLLESPFQSPLQA